MFGIFMLGVFGCGCFYYACKNAKEDRISKENALENNQKYYTDWQGFTRRVDNNHKICKHTTSMEANWDTVDIDLKTGEILRNYSQEKRNGIAEREKIFASKNKMAKEKSIKEGRLWYSSYEETPNGRIRNSIHPYDYVIRRTSDDLLLDVKKTNFNQMVDAKFGFIVWIKSVEDDLKIFQKQIDSNMISEKNITQNDILYYKERYNERLEKTINYNHGLLKETEILDYETGNKMLYSKAQVEEYAEKIGAIL